MYIRPSLIDTLCGTVQVSNSLELCYAMLPHDAFLDYMLPWVHITAGLGFFLRSLIRFN